MITSDTDYLGSWLGLLGLSLASEPSSAGGSTTPTLAPSATATATTASSATVPTTVTPPSRSLSSPARNTSLSSAIQTSSTGTPERIQAFIDKFDKSSDSRTRKSSLTPEKLKERETATDRKLLEKRAFKDRLLKNKLQASMTTGEMKEGVVTTNNRTLIELQQELTDAKIAHERLKNMLQG